MTSRFSKTEAGRAEIRGRALPLSRHARNLLLIIDGSRPAVEWLGLVHGATETDLQVLVEHGLIEGAAAPGAAAGAAASAKPNSVEVLSGAMRGLSYDQLYTLLTGQARERFGLIKGTRFVLDVEKCATLEEMQAVGERFLQAVKQEHGEAGMRHMRLALGIQG